MMLSTILTTDSGKVELLGIRPIESIEQFNTKEPFEGIKVVVAKYTNKVGKSYLDWWQYDGSLLAVSELQRYYRLKHECLRIELAYLTSRDETA